MHSGGGLVSVETAAAFPVRLVESGPVLAFKLLVAWFSHATVNSNPINEVRRGCKPYKLSALHTPRNRGVGERLELVTVSLLLGLR
ncbi:hypothetical protein [Moorena sp. SIO2C4]|uniref:hypothetical protein n=1 Tax=Moorena sp. SIO2C4 TaxID=2607824 RepID=UPI00338E012D